MSKFTEHLWSDLVQEHGATIADTDRSAASRTSLLRRPGALAGSTLGVVALAAALTFGLGALGGPGGSGNAGVPIGHGGTPSPVTEAAYTVTTDADGAVVVTINQQTALPQANAKLAAMGTHEQVGIDMAPGPAAVAGPVSCTPGAGAPKPLPGPPIKVLVGKNGTEVIAPGTTGDNTGVGTWHLASCTVGDDSGNSGTG
jgi:hypothetical protein